MQQRIYKYPLNLNLKSQTVALPKGFRILDIQNQYETPCIWALVDPNETRTEEKVFEIYATGEAVPDAHLRNYLATVQFGRGNLVFHIFELL